MRFITIFFLCGLATLVKTELCSPRMTLGELPKGILAEAVTVVTRGTVADFAGCSSRHVIDPDKIVFWLYNRRHHDVPIRLDHENPSEIDPRQKTVFVIHGWTCNITGFGLPEMKDAFLQRHPNANIILIEWTTYSVDLYSSSFCNIPLISELIGKFICNLNSRFGVDVNQLHLVGHSMGGQISGLVGQETQARCNQKIGRITALDPAGPLYQTISPTRRLDASDAILVDVIHTNQAQLGFLGTTGTVDFFPNCGFLQPGCAHFTPTFNVRDLVNTPLSAVLCNHFRSIELFTESVRGSRFTARSCRLCPGLPPLGTCAPELHRGSTTVMGEDYVKFGSTDSKYYLQTNGRPPFAKE